MPRLILVAFGILLLLLPATASGRSGAMLDGTVAAKLPANRLIRVDSSHLAHLLRVPGSQARIHVGQRVELRESTLRQRGRDGRVLARHVLVARSIFVSRPPSSRGGGASSRDDDELEVKGKLVSLSPLRVGTASGSASCAVPAGRSLSGFAVGDLVEMTCDLEGGAWVLRKLEHEDDVAIGADDDDNSGPGNAHDNDDNDNSGPGSANDSDDDDSGPGDADDDD